MVNTRVSHGSLNLGVHKHKPSKSTTSAYKKQFSEARKRLAAIRECGKVSEEDALLFLPKDASAKKSIAENRWRIKWATYEMSRSWVLYGEVDSFAKCAKHVWSKFALPANGGFECSFELINEVDD